MTNIFLKAKHWQLFLLMVGVPLVSQIYIYARIWLVESVPSTEMENNGFTQVLDEKFIQFEWFPLVMLGFGLLFFGWLWALAIGLQKWVPVEAKMKTTRFKIFFFIPLVYFLFMVTAMSSLFSVDAESFFLNLGVIVAIIVPLHLFSMFCILHIFYFAAKTIKTVELKRKVGFGDFIGEFFLLWFYFIGIWIIQPRVNRLHEQNNVTRK